jgi:hypothetical protein
MFRALAAMQQVADWLAKLGLRQYAQRFAENAREWRARQHWRRR